jgi:hypothetical protein
VPPPDTINNRLPEEDTRPAVIDSPRYEDLHRHRLHPVIDTSNNNNKKKKNN